MSDWISVKSGRLNEPGVFKEIKMTDKISAHEYIGGNYSDNQHANFDHIRMKCKELEQLLLSLPAAGSRTYSDRCISVAKTKLEECCMYAIKAVCFEGKEVL